MISVGDFVPPIFGKAIRKLLPTQPAELFDGDGEMFMRVAAHASVYGEYGMGASSRWMLANTTAKVIAVDTSKAWVAHVQDAFRDEPRLNAAWVDVGPVGDWGMPLGYASRENFAAYVNGIWDAGEQPDMVLVDGRFRVACFLTSLLRSLAGVRIIFDDYANRPHYHLVEEIVKPVELSGRQALFVVPETFDRKAVEALRDHFALVRD